jgi:hypothetical protein
MARPGSKKRPGITAAAVWSSGSSAFGVGKTTLADELQQRLPGAMPLDPESVGFILREWVGAPVSCDFQDRPPTLRDDGAKSQEKPRALLLCSRVRGCSPDLRGPPGR